VKRDTPKRISLLLVDDHPIVLDGLRSHLATRPEIRVVGQANDGQQALRKARASKPDIILLDLSMPGMNGLEFMASLREGARRAKVIVLSMHDNREYITQAIQLGARGYLLKDTSPTELFRAITAVHAGEVYFSPAVSRVVVEEALGGGFRASEARKELLSNRERQVLALVADGFINKEIADRLRVGVRTIETHRERIMRKLNIHSVAGLTRFAIAHGLVPLPQANGVPRRGNGVRTPPDKANP
jgi:two-component system nitrate/nitrite response regulator NarL